MNEKFNSQWNIWIHFNKHSWKINDYKLIFTINSIQDFWNFINNIDTIGGIHQFYFFIMRDKIQPIWEDSANIKGGCLSFRIKSIDIMDIFTTISMLLLGETLYTDSLQINGISITPSKTSFSTLKIWFKDFNNFKVENLHPYFTSLNQHFNVKPFINNRSHH